MVQKESARRTYALQFTVSFALSLTVAALILYAYATRPLAFTAGMLRWGVIALILVAVCLVLMDIVFILKTRDWVWHTKLAVAVVGIVALPPVMYDVYIPPFLLLAIAITLSVCLSVSAFTLQPVNRALSFVYTLAASMVPFTAPILFYILYQVIRMPHIVEIGGVCHIANPTTAVAGTGHTKNTLARKMGDRIHTWRRELLRQRIVRGGEA